MDALVMQLDELTDWLDGACVNPNEEKKKLAAKTARRKKAKK
jgi:hypothetical protein